MRIIAGKWRGRRLLAPAGGRTRPTADRVRQALFDMLLHAPWGGRDAIEGAHVVDAFAGSGALGLEALSRGAAFATLLERDRAARRVLAANVAALQASAQCRVVAADALSPPPGSPCNLVFLDPPYAAGLTARAFAALAAQGWLARQALIVAETGRNEPKPELAADVTLLDERAHGAALLSVWRFIPTAPCFSASLGSTPPASPPARGRE